MLDIWLRRVYRAVRVYGCDPESLDSHDGLTVEALAHVFRLLLFGGLLGVDGLLQGDVLCGVYYEECRPVVFLLGCDVEDFEEHFFDRVEGEVSQGEAGLVLDPLFVQEAAKVEPDVIVFCQFFHLSDMRVLESLF